METDSLTHRLESSQQHLGHSRRSFSCMREQCPTAVLMTYHHSFIASNLAGSYTISIRRSPPHPRGVVSGDAHLLSSATDKKSGKRLVHVATGMSENSENTWVFQGQLGMLKGSNPLERLIDLRIF